MSSHAFLPDFQKQSAAASAATIDKYEIASGEMPRRTHKFADPSPVGRNICAIGRRDVGWYSTIPYALAKSQAHRATNLALFNIRTVRLLHWRLPSHRWFASSDRSLRPAWPDDSRRHHSKYLVVSHFDGTRGPANRNCRYDS